MIERCFRAIPASAGDMDEQPERVVADVLAVVVGAARCIDPSFPSCAADLGGAWIPQPDLAEVLAARARDGERGVDLRIERLATRLASFNAYDEGHLFWIDVVVVGLPEGRTVVARSNGFGRVDLTVAGTPEEVAAIERVVCGVV